MKSLFIIFMFLLNLNSFEALAQCPNQITYSVQVTPESCLFCCDGSAQVVNLMGGCGIPYTIVWQPGNLFGTTVTNLCPGTYTVTVLDNMGGTCCPSVIDTFYIPQGNPTSINEMNSNKGLMIFPNPNNGSFNIIDKQNKLQNSIIEIKNYLGQVILSTQFINQIDISNLSSGIYFLSVLDNSNKKTIKIIKQ